MPHMGMLPSRVGFRESHLTNKSSFYIRETSIWAPDLGFPHINALIQGEAGFETSNRLFHTQNRSLQSFVTNDHLECFVEC